MKWSWFGRAAMGLTSAVALGLSMTACGGGTVAFLWAVGSNPAANSGGMVVGYKVDNYTGNLTAIPGQPFSSQGSNPVQVLVRGGGRFVYVVNQGSGYGPTTNGSGSGIDMFAVGGQGNLTFEQHYDTQGYGHLWAAFDATGEYLFVLDKYNPNYQPDPNKPGYDPNGTLTTFQSDAATGKLIATQQTSSTLPIHASPLYLEVGQNPLRTVATSSCLFTLNSANNTVSTYSIGGGGQLGTVTTGLTTISGATSANSISSHDQYVFVTDNQHGSGPGQIYTYTVGSNCALTPLSPGAVTTNNSTAYNPVNTFLSNSDKYVYVLNGSNPSSQPNVPGSTLSAFSITDGNLNTVSGSPFPVGSGPQCMVEDPTAKFVFTANAGDGTITGYQYSDTRGDLAQLARGSQFKTAATTLSCLAISGSV